jgi:CheY-like chemotaxis protein
METLRVLCVDDDPDIRTLIEIGLTAAGGFELKLCGSGRAALAAIDSFRPDLALLDVVMPDMDGPALMQAIARRANGRRCKVAFLTAAARPSDSSQLAGLGAVAVITKPFDPMSLADTLRRALDGA